MSTHPRKIAAQQDGARRLADAIVERVKVRVLHEPAFLTPEILRGLADQTAALPAEGRRAAEEWAGMDRARSEDTWALVPGILRDRAANMAEPEADRIIRNVRALRGPEVNL